MTLCYVFYYFCGNYPRMKKTYKTNESTALEANEPAVAYRTTQQYSADMSVPIPEGYMSLDVFGEIFHKKLDDCYANIQSNCKQ